MAEKQADKAIPVEQAVVEQPSPLGLSPNEEAKARAAEREVSERDQRRASAEELRKADDEAAARSQRLADEAGRQRSERRPVMARYRALREGFIPNAKLGASQVGVIPAGTEFSYGGVPGAWMEPLDGAAKAATDKRAAEIAERDRKARAVRDAAETLAGVAAR